MYRLSRKREIVFLISNFLSLYLTDDSSVSLSCRTMRVEGMCFVQPLHEYRRKIGTYRHQNKILIENRKNNITVPPLLG